MSRRRRAALVSFGLAPAVAVGVFVGLAFATSRLAPGLWAALLLGAAVAAIGARLAGYRDETGKVVGWTCGAVLASFLAIVLAWVIALIVIVETCKGCFD
jgi:hypothetical protein